MQIINLYILLLVFDKYLASLYTSFMLKLLFGFVFSIIKFNSFYFEAIILI